MLVARREVSRHTSTTPIQNPIPIVHDLDAAIGNGTDDMLHWMVWNVPGAARSLAEGIPQGAELADGSRQISGTGPYYRGPAAAASGPAHHYAFELYALDVMLEVPAVGASPPATPDSLSANPRCCARRRGRTLWT